MYNLKEIHLYKEVVYSGRRYIPLFAVCTMISAVSSFVLFSSVGVLLSNVVALATEQNSEQVFQKTSLYLFFTLLFSLLSSLSTPGFSYIEGGLQLQFQKEMIHRYMHASEQQVEAIPCTEVVNRINRDIPETLKLVGSYISGWIFQPILSGLLSILLLFSIDWTIAALCIICSSINMLIVNCSAENLRKLSTCNAQGKSRIVQFMTECVNGAMEVHTYRISEKLEYRLSKMLQLNSKVVRNYHEREAIRRCVLVFLADCLSIVALLILGAILSKRGYIRFSSIMLALPLVDQIGQAFIAIVNFPTLLKQISPNVERVFEIMLLPQDDTKQISYLCKDRKLLKSEEQEYSNFQDAVCFHNVSFRYGHHDILKELSFSVPRGQKLAIVGESGSGKSTILKLILGLIAPESGWISVNGENTNNMSLEKLRNKIAYFPQDSALFQTTLERNITLCTENIDYIRLISVTKNSGAMDVVNNTLKGFETVYGLDITALSGGQVQRLCLARALYRNASILLMDEPTSALDVQSEELIRQALLNIGIGATLLVVTHRLNLTKEFDRILVISNGKIVEDGTHPELLKLKGVYWDLWNHSPESNSLM